MNLINSISKKNNTLIIVRKELSDILEGILVYNHRNSSYTTIKLT